MPCQWKAVLRNVMENRTSRGFSGPDYSLDESSLARHGVEQAKKILESRHSTVAIMARDPLARFASAFLGKCFSNKCRNRGCIPRRNHQKGSPISFRQAVEYILMPHVNVSYIDVHWKLQSERCGISNGSLGKCFTIIGKMTKESLVQDAECIMKQAGIHRFNLPASPTNDTSVSFWKGGGTPETRYRQETEEEVLRKLFTPTTARLVMKKYQQDYDMLQLPEPGWISQATGEWFDSLDHHACRVE